MKFLADENFSKPSVDLLRESGVDILWISEKSPGITDEKVMKLAIEQERTILTHDSDYGELIFKYAFKPGEGVVYFRLIEFEPDEPTRILINLINTGHEFSKRLTVIDQNSIRERRF